MNKDEIIEKLIYALIIIFFIVGICITFVNEQKYIYECTDNKGEIVYCYIVKNYKGEMTGRTEDGTVVEITSYKRVLEE